MADVSQLSNEQLEAYRSLLSRKQSAQMAAEPPPVMKVEPPKALQQPGIGQRVLENLPGSAMQFGKNLAGMLPGPVANPVMQPGPSGKPQLPSQGEMIQDFMDPFKKVVETVTHPVESFAKDPVGTIAGPAIMAAGGRNVLRNPGIALKEGVKVGAPDVVKGGVKAGVGFGIHEAVPGGPGYLLGSYPMYRGLRQIERGLEKGGEATKAKYQSIPESERFKLFPGKVETPAPRGPKVADPAAPKEEVQSLSQGLREIREQQRLQGQGPSPVGGLTGEAAERAQSTARVAKENRLAQFLAKSDYDLSEIKPTKEMLRALRKESGEKNLISKQDLEGSVKKAKELRGKGMFNPPPGS